MLIRFVFFLFITTCLIFAFSSTGGIYSQDIKVDSLAMNATGGDYTQRISLGVDVVGTSDVNKTRFGILDFVNHPPNVTALSPANGNVSPSKTVIFGFNVTDDFSLNNCSLWTNETGTFIQTQINDSGISINETNSINYTFASNGAYLWNIKCFDSRLDIQQVYSDFYDSNYTITIDEAASETPGSSSDQPDDSSSASKKPLDMLVTKDCPDNSLRVSTQSSGLGVYNVNIKLILSDNTFELKQEKTTDEEGMAIFNLTGEKDGKYYIEASKSGYSKSESYFDFYHCGVNQTNQTTGIDQTVEINQTEPDIEENETVEPNVIEPITEPLVPPSTPGNNTVKNNSNPEPPIIEPPEPTKGDGLVIIILGIIGLLIVAGIYYFFIHKKDI